MTADARRRSPLDGVRLPEGVESCRSSPRSTCASHPAIGRPRRDRRGDQFGLRRSATNNRSGDHHALWLGPDEWLVVRPAGTEVDLVRILRSALGDQFGAVVDASAARTTLELSGPGRTNAPRFGCSLDLDPQAFGPGSCAQTLVARAQVILQQVDAAPAYRLYVRPRSRRTSRPG